MLKTRQPYQPLTKERFTQQHQAREHRALEQRAAKLGFVLQPKPT